MDEIHILHNQFSFSSAVEINLNKIREIEKSIEVKAYSTEEEEGT